MFVIYIGLKRDNGPPAGSKPSIRNYPYLNFIIQLIENVEVFYFLPLILNKLTFYIIYVFFIPW